MKVSEKKNKKNIIKEGGQYKERVLRRQMITIKIAFKVSKLKVTSAREGIDFRNSNGYQ